MKTRITVSLLLCLSGAFIFSCVHGPSKPGKKELIPEKNLISLLTDMYIGDGLLQYSPVRAIYSLKDTNSCYLDIIKKHGYDKEKLDRTLEYYFVNDPKELQKIYDDVLAKLSMIQSRIQTEKSNQKLKTLWNQKTTFSLPDDGVNNPLYFNIPISDTGYFTLSFTATILKNDQSIKPRATVYFLRADSTGKEVKQMWPACELIKDNNLHNYSITGKLKDHSFKMISGFLFDSDPQQGTWIKHAMFNDISLTRDFLK